MAISLDHVSIRGADLAACRRFCVELLGLTIRPRDPSAGQGSGTVVELNDPADEARAG